MTAGPDFSDLNQVATRTIGYNADNMPTWIEHTKGGNTVRTDFVYDGDGVRAKKLISSGGTIYYIGEHFEKKGGTAIKYIFAGNMRITKLEGSTRHYFHKDHLGSSTAMTDSSGSKVEATEYMPFGHMRDHTGTTISNYKFTDQELDPESGLYNYDARLYDPVIGRFISPDSIIPDYYDPQTLNRYSYCRNNPLIYTDPSGHSWLVFNGPEMSITLYSSQGEMLGSWDAANNVTSSSKGQWPEGTFNFVGYVPHWGEGEDSSSGLYGNFIFDVSGRGRTYMGVHSGRKNDPDELGRTGYEHATEGCIRTIDVGTGSIFYTHFGYIYGLNVSYPDALTHITVIQYSIYTGIGGVLATGNVTNSSNNATGSVAAYGAYGTSYGWGYSNSGVSGGYGPIFAYGWGYY